jgi:hypothetical protein
MWEQPPERLLTAGLPLLPRAPVSNATAERLPETLTAVAERLRDEAGPELTATGATQAAVRAGCRRRRSSGAAGPAAPTARADSPSGRGLQRRPGAAGDPPYARHDPVP